MPLTTCPDCGAGISDRAPACPHCGCPNEAVTIQLTSKPLKLQLLLSALVVLLGVTLFFLPFFLQIGPFLGPALSIITLGLLWHGTVQTFIWWRHR